MIDPIKNKILAIKALREFTEKEFGVTAGLLESKTLIDTLCVKLKEKQCAKLSSVQRLLALTEAYPDYLLTGSQALGGATFNSDIDVAFNSAACRANDRLGIRDFMTSLGMTEQPPSHQEAYTDNDAVAVWTDGSKLYVILSRRLNIRRQVQGYIQDKHEDFSTYEKYTRKRIWQEAFYTIGGPSEVF